MKDPSRKRHIAKALTWRIVGSVDTVFLSWLITGNPMTGLKIGFAEVITKMLLYYLHERVWFNINLSKSGLVRENKMRHLAKTVTWRMVGTADTMVLAWLLTGNPLTGVKIGLAELLTKMILYYIHERIWFRIDYGLIDRMEG
ncbi:DUF2061 domain-containing protein [Aequorivita sp. KMM 9714]|uniref:DUF2061 domain-containing protein n=1 Tax=Aequorivita sp. KMM 9714 TaxID=2707173 RepID=UPI0013EA9BE0|nr:DUF2061 domain-containing protein [Aequorivita sp. KMM 9714]NGX84769.1 DUF2061 domain-containing protein [Aequorivita sp. KMM 9714]